MKGFPSDSRILERCKHSPLKISGRNRFSFLCSEWKIDNVSIDISWKLPLHRLQLPFSYRYVYFYQNRPNVRHKYIWTNLTDFNSFLEKAHEKHMIFSLLYIIINLNNENRAQLCHLVNFFILFMYHSCLLNSEV